MKKIIDGKRYDTDTATELAEYSYSHRGDFHWYEETLYKTPKGSYFLVGSGGPMSRYVEAIDQNSWTGASNVFDSLTREDAFEWCQETGHTELIEQEFADLIQDA